LFAEQSSNDMHNAVQYTYVCTYTRIHTSHQSNSDVLYVLMRGVSLVRRANYTYSYEVVMCPDQGDALAQEHLNMSSIVQNSSVKSKYK